MAIKSRRGDRGYLIPTVETSSGHVQVSGEPTSLLSAESVETSSSFGATELSVSAQTGDAMETHSIIVSLAWAVMRVSVGGGGGS